MNLCHWMVLIWTGDQHKYMYEVHDHAQFWMLIQNVLQKVTLLSHFVSILHPAVANT